MRLLSAEDRADNHITIQHGATGMVYGGAFKVDICCNLRSCKMDDDVIDASRKSSRQLIQILVQGL